MLRWQPITIEMVGTPSEAGSHSRSLTPAQQVPTFEATAFLPHKSFGVVESLGAT
jgi:hypothetical protein